MTAAPPSSDELADYIADNYGRCTAEPCACRKSGKKWQGRGCLNWQPCGAPSWEHLKLCHCPKKGKHHANAGYNA